MYHDLAELKLSGLAGEMRKIGLEIGKIYKIDPESCSQNAAVTFIVGTNLKLYFKSTPRKIMDVTEPITGAVYLGISKLKLTTGLETYFKFLYNNKFYLFHVDWVDSRHKLKITEIKTDNDGQNTPTIEKSSRI